MRGWGSVKGFDPKGVGLMSNQHPLQHGPVGRVVRYAPWAVVMALFAGCGMGNPNIPPPRPIIIHSGATIHASKARLDSINKWVTREEDDIQNNPSFMVDARRAPGQVYPWSYLGYAHDSVRVMVDMNYPESVLPFEIYAHLHLMARRGPAQQKKWLPEAPTATGFALERAILARVADAWLLARAVYGATPYAPLDELLYAHEDGYLDAMIFTALPTKYAEARKEWARKNPDAAQKYRMWFQNTFNKEPPGLQG